MCGEGRRRQYTFIIPPFGGAAKHFETVLKENGYKKWPGNAQFPGSIIAQNL